MTKLKGNSMGELTLPLNCMNAGVMSSPQLPLTMVVFGRADPAPLLGNIVELTLMAEDADEPTPKV